LANPLNPPVDEIPHIFRHDPFVYFEDAEFKQHFRFTKENVRRLILLLDLKEPKNQRGRPIAPKLVLCIALNCWGSGMFLRGSAYCADVKTPTAWRCCQRVRLALHDIAPHVIHLPGEAAKAATAARMLAKYHLPRFAYAIDGMLAYFDHAPVKIPVGEGFPLKQHFWTRKGGFGINVMIISNDRKLIHVVDATYHGAVHDARVWNHSDAKALIEADPHYLLAGDSGYFFLIFMYFFILSIYTYSFFPFYKSLFNL
jgi:hypothetical protein